MGISFDTGEYAKLDNQSWMDGSTTATIFARARWDVVTTANDQYIFMLRADGTEQVSIRKRATTDKVRVSITAGGDVETCDSIATTVSAGVVYNVAMVWEKGIANGLECWVNGTQENTVNTTAQGTFDTMGTGDLHVGKRTDENNRYFEGTVERLIIWKNWKASQSQLQRLGEGYWPHQIGAPQPQLFYPFFDFLTNRIVDFSGNLRHIESSGITGTLAAGGLLGQWMDPSTSWGGSVRSSSAVTPPNPWTLVDTVLHEPAIVTYQSIFSGRTNGTPYEYYVSACDASGNESNPSAIVETTPVAPPPAVSTLTVPWRRVRRFSKWRVSQQ